MFTGWSIVKYLFVSKSISPISPKKAFKRRVQSSFQVTSWNFLHRLTCLITNNPSINSIEERWLWANTMPKSFLILNKYLCSTKYPEIGFAKQIITYIFFKLCLIKLTRCYQFKLAPRPRRNSTALPFTFKIMDLSGFIFAFENNHADFILYWELMMPYFRFVIFYDWASTAIIIKVKRHLGYPSSHITQPSLLKFDEQNRVEGSRIKVRRPIILPDTSIKWNFLRTFREFFRSNF